MALSPRWRNWQTRMVEGHVDTNVRVGSSPALGINYLEVNDEDNS